MCKALNHFEHIFVFVSAVSGCISIFALTSLVGITIAIMSSALGLRVKCIVK